jgi:hypothetical protein
MASALRTSKVSFDSEGMTDYCVVSLYLTGIVPEGGFNVLLLLDGFTNLWSCPVDAFLYSMQHLKKIMAEKYSDTHIRVRSFDQVTQAILKDKNKAGARDLFWGKPQEIHLKNQCTSNVTMKMTPYPRRDVPTGCYKSVEHRQFNTIELKVKLAAQCKTTMKRTKTKKPIELFSTQEGSTLSPDACARHRGEKKYKSSSKYRDWGGSRHETGRASRVSNESND